VSLLSTWIQSGGAHIVISPYRMELDPTCPTRLDTLNDAECPVVPITTHTGPSPIYFKTTTAKMMNPESTTKATFDQKGDSEAQGNIDGNAPASTVAGFFVGGIIAVLLLVLIVIASVILFFTVRDKTGNRYSNEN